MLNELALKFGTDKSSNHHNYCDVYESYLRPIKSQIERLVEIGVGGYTLSHKGGESARMWAEYLPFAKIITIDVYEKNLYLPRNVSFHKISQVDTALIPLCIDADIIIDDGSHQCQMTLTTFENLFPVLKPGGIYFIEDIESSWYELHGYGGCADPNNTEAHTPINYFKSVINDLSAKFIPNYSVLNPISEQILSVHFYKNMIVVKKK